LNSTLSYRLIICALISFTLFSYTNILAQNSNKQIELDKILNAKSNQLDLLATDVADYEITHQHLSKKSGIEHYYLRQQHNGIPIFDGVMGLHINKQSELIKFDSDFISNIKSKVNTEKASISIQAALSNVAAEMNYDISKMPSLKSSDKKSKNSKAIYNQGSISRNEIPVQLVYFQSDDGSLKLAWDIAIAEKDDADYWNILVDAQTGEILYKNNWTRYCDFEHEVCNHENAIHNNHKAEPTPSYQVTVNNAIALKAMPAPNSYRVYPEPVESPNHGGRQLITNPADLVASPFGWHDTNGSTGAEYTITRGNNVYAQEDANGNDGTGFSPNGTSNLDFDFGLNLTQSPNSSPNRESGIVNLFYWNNLLHDVWYQYGFDEASGNFQQNNYGNGGLGGDFVFADAQDGSDINNAVFSSPPDGINGYMEMYLWTGASTGAVVVNSPNNIAGNYTSVAAQFGQSIYSITGNLVIADDGSASSMEACNPLVNGAAINGNIAVLDRGNCEFGVKCLNAQNAGAIAVIVCNNVAGAPIAMAPGAQGANVTIPALMLSQQDCNTIKAQIPTVNVSITSGTAVSRDGDFDNAIIAHEYGHGISIRLTGGAGNSNCLDDNEQMGEGWSDYFGLMMTIDPSDSRTDVRPIATFAIGQSTTGSGIRTYPYTTDMTINPHTYNDIGSEAIPHGVGSVWCAMLWEMTWDLIDQYGFDADLHYGTGGNNIAMELVIEGLKLQPCEPGFVDGRDAIIAADQAINGGVNVCLIREAFARRGLGDNASQGTTTSTTDGTEDYNVSCGPPSCTDGILNQDEDGIDCGGANCPPCPDEVCDNYDFQNAVVSYDANDNDNGTATVLDNGATVYITGNGWKAVPINYNVSPITVLEFDFKSSVEGEIHEIAFDNDLVITPPHRIVVYGNQGYAGTFTNPVYSGSGNYEHFTIPLGANFTGTFNYMVLTCDDDANATGESFFSNVVIYEDYNGNLNCDSDCETLISLTNPVSSNTYHADVEVNCNSSIINSNNVIFKAGTIVSLEDGFEVPLLSDFEAIIEDCP